MADNDKPAGNRGKGRPKGAVNKTPDEFKASCREYSARVVKFWQDTLDSPDSTPEHKFIAAQRLAEYGHGKPAQEVTNIHSGELTVSFINDWREKKDK